MFTGDRLPPSPIPPNQGYRKKTIGKKKQNIAKIRIFVAIFMQ
jgi:hypothetical protein